MQLLARLLDKKKLFLEIGPGDCALAFHVAAFVRHVYAVDVSTTITRAAHAPENFSLLFSDGSTLPVPPNSIDIIYSNQLVEHLHPDDVDDHLTSILGALAPGGVYLCITPNRLNGPHDISRYFDSEATGFHLREYTIAELSSLFKRAGFSKVLMYIGAWGHYIRCPIFPAALCESLLERLPEKMRRRLAGFRPIRAALRVRLLGFKDDRDRLQPARA
jgi:SAM-dependent methyltransferase